MYVCTHIAASIVLRHLAVINFSVWWVDIVRLSSFLDRFLSNWFKHVFF